MSTGKLGYGRFDMTEDMVQYRSISALAVLALVLGLASFLALFHVMLWVLPFVAVVTGVAAIRRIATSGDSLTGRTMASLGIMSACLFASWAITQYVVIAQRVEREAREFTSAWMELVKAGNAHRLHQQNLIPTDRIRDEVRMAEYYKNNADAKKNLDKFIGGEPIQTAMQLGPTLKWSISGRILQAIERGNRYVSVPIHVSGTNAGKPWAADSILSLHRTVSKIRSDWRVAAWGLPEKS